MTSAGANPLAHPALLYGSDEEYVDQVAPFVAGGVRAGEPVMVAVPPHRLALLDAALGSDRGATDLVDMAEFGRNPGALLSRFHRFVGQDGQGPCRIVGEPVWPERTADEYAACVQHEALINTAFRDHPVTVLCPYDTAVLSTAVLADVVATHPVVRQHGAETASSGYAPEETLARHNTPLAPGEDAEWFEVPDVEAVPPARRFATERARRAGLSGERVDDVEMVVHELVANSIEHTGGRCRLAVWRDGGELVCLVADGGVFADRLAGCRWPRPDQPRGRGLYLVNHLANLVRTHTSLTGTTILARL